MFIIDENEQVNNFLNSQRLDSVGHHIGENDFSVPGLSNICSV